MDYSNIVEKYNKILEAQELLGSGSSNKFDGTDISLPRIAVVGGQSAGKSSVLESVVGFEFLPRGTGIVTRRPLLVELSPSTNGETKITLTDSSSNFSRDFSSAMEVKDAIKAATDNHEECRNDGISKASLVLKISKPGLPYLTMIDLPGMTRNPVGNQPPTIANDIQRLVLSYINNETTMILAVSPSTIDIANCEAVRIAREVDPAFQRTIGVYTKLDDGFYDSRGLPIPEAKEKAKSILSQELASQRVGLPTLWIPVKCRRTGLNSTAIDDQHEDEKEFFENTFFPAMKFECPYGIRHLSQVLTTRLERELQKMWPNIEASVKALYKEKKAELEEWEIHNDEGRWTSTVDMVIDEYAETFREQLLGQDRGGSLDASWIGAKIVDIFKGEFVRDMESIDPLEDFSRDRLARLIKNSRGLDDGHFLQFGVLKRVVHHNLKKIEEFCLKCVHSTCHELRAHAVSIPVGKNSSGNLTRWIHRTTCAKLEEWEDDCVDLVTALVEMEKRINPDHPDYPRVLTYDEAKSLVLEEKEKEERAKRKKNQPKKTRSSRSQRKTEKTPPRRSSSPGTMNPPTPASGFAETDDPSKMSILTLRKIVIENGYNEEQTYRMRRTEMEAIVAEATGFTAEPPSKPAKQADDGTMAGFLVDLDEDPSENGAEVDTEGADSATEDAYEGNNTTTGESEYTPTKRSTNKRSDDEEIEIIRFLLVKVFDNVIRIKVIDSVPKAITLKLVEQPASQKLKHFLIGKINEIKDADGGLRKLMGKTEDDEKKQEECEKLVHKLEDVMQSFK